MDRRKFSKELERIEGHCCHSLLLTREAIDSKRPQVDVLDALLMDSQTLLDIANETERMISRLIADSQAKN